jgi:hypothetical protein
MNGPFGRRSGRAALARSSAAAGVAALALLTVARTPAAAQVATVVGRVVADDSKAPLPGVGVRLRGTE